MKYFAALGVLLLAGCGAERDLAPVVVAPPVVAPVAAVPAQGVANPVTRPAAAAPVQVSFDGNSSYKSPSKARPLARSHQSEGITTSGYSGENDSLLKFFGQFIAVKVMHLRSDSPIRNIKAARFELLHLKHAFKSRTPQASAERYAIMALESLDSALTSRPAMTGRSSDSPENSDRLKEMEAHLRDAIKYSEWCSEAVG